MRSGKFALSIIVPLVVFLLGIYLFLPSFSRPALSSPISTTLTVISDDVFLQREGSDSWERIVKEVSLEQGDSVKTSSEGRAVIIFFEGSSTEIEPDSIVRLEELFSTLKGSTTVRLNQPAGQTWNRVEKLFDPASRFEVQTSAAAAVVRGTLISIDVTDNGTTEVGVLAGEAGVSGQGQEVTVPTGWQTTVNLGEPPSSPSPIPPPSSQLAISVGSSAWLNVVDPVGRSTGIIPPGFEINQIPFSATAIFGEEQTVRIDEPTNGTYYLIICAHDNGSIQLTVNGTSQAEFNQQENREFEVKQDWGYYIALDLNVDQQGFIVSLSLGKVRALEPDFVTEKFYGIKYRSYLS